MNVNPLENSRCKVALLKLSKELLSIEEERLNGEEGLSIEELDNLMKKEMKA